MIPLEIKEQIRSKINIVDVVREYIPTLKKTGHNYKALCPFHREKTPSFLVNPDKGIFHCFGCHQGGDVINFVKLIDNIGYGEAMHKLARRANITIRNEHLSPEIILANNQRSKLYKLNELVADFYHQMLINHRESRFVLEYLKSRNISIETVKLFQVGYAPGQGTILTDLLVKRGYSQEELQQAGVIVFSETTKKYYDWFRNRLMFPIFDVQSRVVGFGGRALDEYGESHGKYINSPETMVFSKGKILYGLHRATKSIRSENQSNVVEGYMDVIALHQAGIENTVAPLGTALTDEQCYLLRQRCNEIMLIFDSDVGGTNASLRSSEILLESNFTVKVMLLPEEKDPDQIIQEKGKEAFLQLLKEAYDSIEFQFQLLLKKYDQSTRNGRMKILNEIIPTIAKIKNLVLKKEWVHTFAERLSFDEEAILGEIKKYSKGHSVHETETVNTESTERLTVEEELLTMLLQDFSLLDVISSQIEPSNFMDERARKIFEYLQAAVKNGETVTVPQLLDTQTEEEHAKWLAKLVVAELSYKNKDKTVLGLIKRIRQRETETRWHDLSNEISAMLEGRIPFDQLKINEYQELTKNLKGSRI